MATAGMTMMAAAHVQRRTVSAELAGGSAARRLGGLFTLAQECQDSADEQRQKPKPLT